MWPVLFEWNGTIIYSYPLFIGLSWGLGFRLAEARLPTNVSQRSFLLWMLGLFVSSWVGAKLLFMLTQDQWAIGDLARATNFWLGGGFVFLGGFLGGSIYSFLAGLCFNDLHWTRMNFTIVPMLYAHALGRLGCFLAGCCYGTQSNLPWAFEVHGAHRHPVQLYEAGGLLLLAWLLDRRTPSSQRVAWYLVGYGVVRWLVELLRGDELRGGFAGQSTSQWLSLALLLIGLGLLARSKVSNPQKA